MEDNSIHICLSRTSLFDLQFLQSAGAARPSDARGKVHGEWAVVACLSTKDTARSSCRRVEFCGVDKGGHCQTSMRLSRPEVSPLTDINVDRRLDSCFDGANKRRRDVYSHAGAQHVNAFALC